MGLGRFRKYRLDGMPISAVTPSIRGAKSMKNNQMAWLFAMLASILLFGCGESTPAKPQFLSTDITGVAYAKNFDLTDHNGKRRTLADFRGKVVIMFFGYTHCPDVCPTTLSDMSIALKQLGNEASKVQVLFVTVDPARDKPALLAQYVPAFYPTFLGLYGTDSEIANTAKEFKVFYQKHESGSREGYSVDHSAGSYVFDPQGRVRLYMAYGAAPGTIVHDISLLLNGK